ncbi:hypothetical protein [Rhizobium leguminosarum]|uniref:hypothetical protein n=1 Tax=Rhizobium leguminosarum TaxID=384 RepID=UPI001FED39F3|nr:hypothetical protein [Rhizobium leguminosarum]
MMAAYAADKAHRHIARDIAKDIEHPRIEANPEVFGFYPHLAKTRHEMREGCQNEVIGPQKAVGRQWTSDLPHDQWYSLFQLCQGVRRKEAEILAIEYIRLECADPRHRDLQQAREGRKARADIRQPEKPMRQLHRPGAEWFAVLSRPSRLKRNTIADDIDDVAPKFLQVARIKIGRAERCLKQSVRLPLGRGRPQITIATIMHRQKSGIVGIEYGDPHDAKS